MGWFLSMRRKKFLTSFFRQLNYLQQAIFSIYIKKNYNDHRDRYEIKIHKKRQAVLYAMQKLRIVLNKLKESTLITYLEQIYEIVFSLHCLTLRVNDHAVFAVCEAELKNVTHALTDVIDKMNTEKFIDMSRLSAAIFAFDELYRGTLKIVAADPMVFLFFIEALVALHDELEQITHVMTKK